MGSGFHWWRGARALVVFIFVIGLLTNGTENALAGFGITPPYVKSDRLTRGSVFEQRIGLVRSDPEEDLRVEITMNIPEIEHWFSIDRGREFILPEGTRQVPIIVTVTVPPDAEYKKYEGAIRIRTSPVDSGSGGGVSIALGAQVDVAIEVVDKILDFKVRKVRMADLEEGRTKWGLFFPGKIRFFMTVENTGNADYGPTQVRLDIYDSEGEILRETTTNTNKIRTIAPFTTEELVAELPTRLLSGRYTAKYTIFKGDEISSQNEINLSVAALGAVAGYEGYGIWGLSTSDKVKAGAVLGTPILLLLALMAFVVVRRKNFKKRRAIQGDHSALGLG